MNKGIAQQVKSILAAYDPDGPRATADALRTLWLQHDPKSMAGIKAEQRAKQETVGIPVPILKSIGREVGKAARKRVDDFVPLTRLLWDEYGREGRVVAVIPLGAMELVRPEAMLPLLLKLCRGCITWEDADQFAMSALEPIVRKDPDNWLPAMEPWLENDNKWVRRAGVIVVGRLPLVHPDYAARCLKLTERLLLDPEVDVKRAVSFAIRLIARGKIEPVYRFLAHHVPPDDPAATWVLCDAIRSMTKKFLPDFVPLMPLYEQWANDPALSARDRGSVESAIRTLRQAAG